MKCNYKIDILSNLKLFILSFIRHVTLTRINVVKYIASKHQQVLQLYGSHALDGQILIIIGYFDATISLQNGVRQLIILLYY